MFVTQLFYFAVTPYVPLVPYVLLPLLSDNKKASGQFEADLRLVGGVDRSRTGVDGFADHCLTTRPPRLRESLLYATLTQCPTENTVFLTFLVWYVFGVQKGRK